MTLQELATAAGVGLPAASMALKRKGIPHERLPGGAIFLNPADPKVVAYMTKSSARRRSSQKEKAARPETGIPVSEPKPAPPRPAAPKASEPTPPPSPRSDPKPTEQASAFDLDDQKTEQQIEKLRLDNEQTRKELVKRDDIKAVFAKFYGVHASELTQLPTKIGKDLALRFGRSDPEATMITTEVIDREIFQSLETINRIMKEFLETLEEIS